MKAKMVAFLSCSICVICIIFTGKFTIYVDVCCFVIFSVMASCVQKEVVPKDTAAQTNGMSTRGTVYSAVIGGASAVTVKLGLSAAVPTSCPRLVMLSVGLVLYILLEVLQVPGGK